MRHRFRFCVAAALVALASCAVPAPVSNPLELVARFQRAEADALGNGTALLPPGTFQSILGTRPSETLSSDTLQVPAHCADGSALAVRETRSWESGNVIWQRVRRTNSNQADDVVYAGTRLAVCDGGAKRDVTNTWAQIAFYNLDQAGCFREDDLAAVFGAIEAVPPKKGTPAAADRVLMPKDRQPNLKIEIFMESRAKGCTRSIMLFAADTRTPQAATKEAAAPESAKSEGGNGSTEPPKASAAPPRPAKAATPVVH